MNILKNKGFVAIFLLFLVFACSTFSDVRAQGKQSDVASLEQVKILLNEGLEYLKVNAFTQAKDKFEEALKIAPEEIAGEIRSLVARVSDMDVRREELTKDVVIKSEAEAQKISELQQNIIQFEKEQKKRIYLDQGKLSFDQGEYEQALLEFNKILTMNSQDKDAILYIEKTNSAIEKDKQMQAKRIQEYRANAKTYYRDKKYDSAINELEKIIVANPSDAEALEYMNEVKLSKAEMDEYKRLEDMVDMGKEYLKDKDYDKAIQIWKQVLVEDKDYPGVETLIAQTEFNKAKGEVKVVGEKIRADREEKMLKIDSAFVPVIGGTKKATEEKTEVDEELLAMEEIKKMLKEKKVTLEFTDADLRSVILFLSRQSGVNMMIDEAIFGAEGMATGTAGMPAAGMGPENPGAFSGESGAETPAVSAGIAYNVTASLRNVPLVNALSLILRPKGLDYEIYPDVIWISTKYRIDSIPLEALETKIFDLQFGGSVRGQLRPQPLQLETISFGETSGGSGSSGGGGGQ